MSTNSDFSTTIKIERQFLEAFNISHFLAPHPFSWNVLLLNMIVWPATIYLDWTMLNFPKLRICFPNFRRPPSSLPIYTWVRLSNPAHQSGSWSRIILWVWSFHTSLHMGFHSVLLGLFYPLFCKLVLWFSFLVPISSPPMCHVI